MAATNGTKSTFKPDNSSKSISASQVFGINRLVKLLIVIEGKIIKHYKHFTLSQNSAKHHRFEMILAYDSLGKREDHNLESSNEFLGKRITVVQKYKDIPDSPERTFVGVITEVAHTGTKWIRKYRIIRLQSDDIIRWRKPYPKFWWYTIR